MWNNGDYQTGSRRLALPSGSSVSMATWEAIMVNGGEWREWLDEYLYSPEDQAFLDQMASQG